MQVQMLYNGLNYQTRQLIEIASGRSLRNKYPNEAAHLFEDMAAMHLIGHQGLSWI